MSVKRLVLFGATLGVFLAVVGCGSPGKAPCTPFTCQPAAPTAPQPNVLLTVIITPSGDGTVSVATASTTDCTTNCTLPFTSGSGPITLTAAPDLGHIFVTWAGCVNVSGAQCTHQYAKRRPDGDGYLPVTNLLDDRKTPAAVVRVASTSTWMASYQTGNSVGNGVVSH